jgi:molecular chaperone GrpE
MDRAAEGEAIVTLDDSMEQPNAVSVDTAPVDGAPVDGSPVDTAPVDGSPVESAAELAPVAVDQLQTPQPPDDLRSRMMLQFEQWLDQMLADEPPPRGLPEEFLAQANAQINGESPAGETDLYTLFSALTSLTGEIRLQGRAFKQLTDLLSPLSETPALLAQLHESQNESAELLQQMKADTAAEDENPPVEFKQVCDVMIDLYDRLARGLQTCDEGTKALTARSTDGWLQRLTGEAARSMVAVQSVQAIRDAGGLTLTRLSAAMADWGIQRIGKVGEIFDAERMSAVDVRTDSAAPPGTVLVVNRSGYALNGVLKATALVTVSK